MNNQRGVPRSKAGLRKSDFEAKSIGFEVKSVGFEVKSVGFEVKRVGFEVKRVGFEVVVMLEYVLGGHPYGILPFLSPNGLNGVLVNQIKIDALNLLRVKERDALVEE